MISEAFWKKLDALALRMRTPAGGGAGGQRRSRALGSSVEFSDFREYAAGDDPRRVDWNAYARFERLYVKLFMEEQETRVTLLLDASASMAPKWELACDAAQALAYLALLGGDQVALAILREDRATCLPPLTGRGALPRIRTFLGGIAPAGRTSLEQALAGVPLPDKGGLSVLLSDLLCPDGGRKALQWLRYRHQESYVLQTLSPGELRPELEGAVELLDSETGEKLELQASYEALREYAGALEAFEAEIQAECRRQQAGYALLDAGMDVEKTLLGQLTRAGLLG